MNISMNTLIRTIRFQIKTDAPTRAALLETIQAYTSSFNRVAKVAWEGRISNGVQLHHDTYYAEREVSGLPSQLTISARMKATEAIKSVKELTKKVEAENKRREKENIKLEVAGKRARKMKRIPTVPQSESQAIRYDARSHTINFHKNIASLVTKDGRKQVNLVIPAYWQDIANTWKNSTADLFVDRQGRLWLNVVMQKDVLEVAPTGEVIGIDLGIVNPATDSNGTYYGNTHWASVEKRRKTLVSKLQSKGTKSAKRHLKKLSGTRARFRSDCDHVISRQILNHLKPGDTIVFEDLKNIRGRNSLGKKMRERMHSWSFDRLQFCVGYKALEKGITVEYCDPRYSSQRCNKCSHTERANRQSQAEFECVKCGHQDNADRNAARNIRDNHLRSSASSPLAAQARKVLVCGQEAAQARKVLVCGQEAAQARKVLVCGQEAAVL
jgi:putative transposase